MFLFLSECGDDFFGARLNGGKVAQCLHVQVIGHLRHFQIWHSFVDYAGISCVLEEALKYVPSCLDIFLMVSAVVLNRPKNCNCELSVSAPMVMLCGFTNMTESLQKIIAASMISRADRM